MDVAGAFFGSHDHPHGEEVCGVNQQHMGIQPIIITTIGGECFFR